MLTEVFFLIRSSFHAATHFVHIASQPGLNSILHVPDAVNLLTEASLSLNTGLMNSFRPSKAQGDSILPTA
ncbi:hypothetical protein P9112_007586 [Eukaryota sp. TZLM1-RC]